MDIFEFSIIFFLGVLSMVILINLIAGPPIFSHNSIAEMVCESHGLELDYHEDGLDRIVCEERPENLSNKKVFEFD